jgi:hypothetical protein
MEWARILAYITGTADHELLLQHEYLLAEKVGRDGSRSTVKSSNSATRDCCLGPLPCRSIVESRAPDQWLPVRSFVDQAFRGLTAGCLRRPTGSNRVRGTKNNPAAPRTRRRWRQ